MLIERRLRILSCAAEKAARGANNSVFEKGSRSRLLQFQPRLDFTSGPDVQRAGASVIAHLAEV